MLEFLSSMNFWQGVFTGQYVILLVIAAIVAFQIGRMRKGKGPSYLRLRA